MSGLADEPKKIILYRIADCADESPEKFQCTFYFSKNIYFG
jgi:hypothetical protein